MDLRPYICERCNGTINPRTFKCEYCDTPYKDESLKRLVIDTRVPGEVRLKTQVELSHEDVTYNPEGMRDYTLRQLRNQLADALLGYMKIETSHNPSMRTEIIRGEVRVVDPSFSQY